MLNCILILNTQKVGPHIFPLTHAPNLLQACGLSSKQKHVHRVFFVRTHDSQGGKSRDGRSSAAIGSGSTATMWQQSTKWAMSYPVSSRRKSRSVRKKTAESRSLTLCLSSYSKKSHVLKFDTDG